ncbi:hypothetical protein BDF19DRAFT_445073 [Syncephalis fuscata]|nr:hypothetical protein BDF19DRAFT_445073 [Syncephalis fuscata]
MLRYLWKSVFDPSLAGEIRCPPSPSPSMRAALEADAGAAVDRVRRVLDVPHARLLRVCHTFARTLNDAVTGRPSSLDARPSHLHQLPTGAETGTYLAMDLGTSLIHVACVSFFGGGLHEVQQVQHAIPEVIKSADADTFFNFLADVVVEALRESGGLMLSSMHLGVTWSFRLDQNALDDGTLVHWSKEFSVTGVEGRDVVRLLQKALDNRGLGIKVVAIVNDSVSNLIAGAYSLPHPDFEDDDMVNINLLNAPCLASCIMGSGTNAAYLERTSRVDVSLGAYHSFAISHDQQEQHRRQQQEQQRSYFQSIPFSPAYHTNGFAHLASLNDDRDCDQKRERSSPELTVVNTEWGDLTGVPLTPWDEPTPAHLRSASTNSTFSILQNKDSKGSGKRTFERMVGAAYLGRIVGRIVASLISNGELFCRLIEALPNIAVAFTIDELITIESDNTDKLVHVGDVVARLFRLDPKDVCVVDRLLLQQITRLVSNRAARLHAAAIAALVAQLHRTAYISPSTVRSSDWKYDIIDADKNDNDSSVKYDNEEDEFTETIIINDDTNDVNILADEQPADTLLYSDKWLCMDTPLTDTMPADEISVYSMDSSLSGAEQAKMSLTTSTLGDSRTLVSSPKASWTWTSTNMPTVQLTLSEGATPVASTVYSPTAIPDSLARAFKQLMVVNTSTNNTLKPSNANTSEAKGHLVNLFGQPTKAELNSIISDVRTASPQDLQPSFDFDAVVPVITMDTGSSDTNENMVNATTTAIVDMLSPPTSSSSTAVLPTSSNEPRWAKGQRPPPISTSSVGSHATFVATPTLSQLPGGITAATTAVTTPEEKPLRSRASYTKRPAYPSSSRSQSAPIPWRLSAEPRNSHYRSSIASIASVTDAYASVTIVVDGLLFRHYPHYSTRVHQALQELIGAESVNNIYLVPTHESAGCIGAALVALLSTNCFA